MTAKKPQNINISKFRKHSETNCLSPEDISQNVSNNRKVLVSFDQTLKKSLNNEATMIRH